MNALEVGGLAAGYGSLDILRGLDLTVRAGEIVALLGANGAGKTTTLRAISGLLRHKGSIRLDGTEIGRLSAARRATLGLAHVPQGRGTFTDFTVEENLRLGAYPIRDKARIERDMEQWFVTFPRLKERRGQIAGSLSGGEQQMLAIARAMMTRPRLLMCDEPSLGLAPSITAELFALLKGLSSERGMSVLVVEQNAHLTLDVAERAYVIEHGAIALHGSAAALKRDATVQRAYLGIDA
jgi:branched-chain amino acid transport system ATP-binding protein